MLLAACDQTDAAVMTPMIVKNLNWPDESATREFASRLADYWQQHPDSANLLVLLHGDLGAGTTTLVRHLLRGLPA